MALFCRSLVFILTMLAVAGHLKILSPYVTMLLVFWGNMPCSCVTGLLG